ncbi:glycosyltransferase family 4 protein [Paenibacillus sp. NPDC056579]|uniref:glycosyltransferase family 4 protein n=1 Tax=Paenibacillus sp. NPDC056579 TaxID=3345871 RepID=UPI0036B0E3A8
MSVYLDAQPLLGPRSGVSNYVRNLYKELVTLNLDIELFFNRIAKNIHVNELDLQIDQRPKIINSRYPYKVIRRLLQPGFLYNYPFDWFNKSSASIFHGTNFTHIPINSKKTVITIHDLAYMIYPETTSEKIYKHHSIWVPYSARNASKIIAVSQHTKKDIIELLGVPEEKIEVIYLSADHLYRPLNKNVVQVILNKYSLPDDYILFVGTLEPRKNLIGLLKAFHYLINNHKCDHKLVIVGAKGWKFSPILDFIRQNNLETRVIFTGFIEDDDLAALYNGATLFVMPSIYEGFGIPILEAMNCGVPVIASDVSAIPEIVDKYGVLLPPNNYEQWATEIYRLINDTTKLNKYKELSLERATHFNWQKTALETKMVYDKIMNM